MMVFMIMMITGSLAVLDQISGQILSNSSIRITGISGIDCDACSTHGIHSSRSDPAADQQIGFQCSQNTGQGLCPFPSVLMTWEETIFPSSTS